MRQRKTHRLRGSRTNGWGSHKKHRGKGNKGGWGNAGTGKRADSKKPSIWNNPKYFGKYGFKIQDTVIDKTINVSELDEKILYWVTQKKAQSKDGIFQVNLTELGYTKLLGTGKVTKKIQAHIAKAVPSAARKITEAGGSVITEKTKE